MSSSSGSVRFLFFFPSVLVFSCYYCGDPPWQLRGLIKFRCLKWRKIRLGPFLVSGIFHRLNYDGISTILIEFVADIQ